MNPTLRERVIRAEQHFLLAIASNDEESLKAFFQDWTRVARDIQNTKAAGRLDDNTAHLISEASQAIENVTVCMLESGSILQESLACSISDFIQDIDIPSTSPSIPPHHSQAVAPCRLLFSDHPSSTILGQQELLDSYAYCWLMQNIHDPYPNSMQMQIISNVSGTSTAQVELWFQEARDSIGWNRLSCDFFTGSVSATVAAARRVYLERDKTISFDIAFAFTTVKAFAETLFLEYPALQGKDINTGSVEAIRTVAMGQDHHIGSSPGESIIDTDGIVVLPQADLAPLDPLSDLSDSDESEEEDTTPPPPIAGCKRVFAEEEFTSQAADLGRPQKRPRCVVIFFSVYRTEIDWYGRTWAINWISSEPECPPPLPSTLGLSYEQTAYMSAAPVSCYPSLHPLSPTLPESSPDPSRSISQKRGYTEDTLGGAVDSIHTGVSVHGIRKRRLSQCVSPAPSKRQRRPSPDEYPQPSLQVSIDPDIPVSLDVFDWNSMFAGTTPSICMLFHMALLNSSLSSLILR